MKTTKTKTKTIQPHFLDEFLEPLIDEKQQEIINEIQCDYDTVN